MVNVKLVESSSTFNYLGALKGGVIACYDCSFTLTSSVITNTRAYTGGVFYVDEYCAATPLVQSAGSITDSKSYMDGGVGYIKATTS